MEYLQGQFQIPHYARRCWPIIGSALVALLAAACLGCSSTPVVRPKIGTLPQPKQQNLAFNMNQNIRSLAPSSVVNTDPSVCLVQGASDPNEKPLGGRTSIAPYTYSTQPHIQDMY